MGCDIHCYIEYRGKTDEGHWDGFGGRINPGRFYAMFSIMAGVRKYDGSPTLFKPKGLPDDLGWESNSDNCFYITDTPSDSDDVTKAKAHEWVAKGYSKLVDEHRVTNPDWHSHSWLTTNEYNEAIKAFKKSCANSFLDPRYTAILDCLRSFERQGFESRLVFWFDN